jgi:hypothetical protein
MEQMVRLNSFRLLTVVFPPIFCCRYSDLELEDLAIESRVVDRMADMLVRARCFVGCMCCKRDTNCAGFNCLRKQPVCLFRCPANDIVLNRSNQCENRDSEIYHNHEKTWAVPLIALNHQRQATAPRAENSPLQSDVTLQRTPANQSTAGCSWAGCLPTAPQPHCSPAFPGDYICVCVHVLHAWFHRSCYCAVGLINISGLASSSRHLPFFEAKTVPCALSSASAVRPTQWLQFVQAELL